MEVRNLGPADWQIQKKLIFESFKDSPGAFPDSGDTWNEDLSTRFYKREGFACILIDDKKEARGLLMGTKGELSRLWVAPNYREKGNGVKLLNTYLAWAKKSNSSSFILKVYRHNQRAINFYESTGFHKTEETDGELIYMKYDCNESNSYD